MLSTARRLTAPWSALTAVTVLFYALTSLVLLAGLTWHTSGKNPAWVFALFAALAVGMTLTAAIRGARLTGLEATGFLAVYLAGTVSMSISTHLDLGAFSNGLVLPMLGIYTGWLLPRWAAAVFYIGVAAWAVAVITRGDALLSSMATIGLLQAVIVTEIVHILVQRSRRMMYTDPLTGALNRAGLERALGRHMPTRGRRTPLSLAMVDLDGLREVNNNQGHAAGDALLVAAAREWLGALSGAQEVARLGGDEFVLLLPEMSEEAALAFVRRMRADSLTSWTYGVAEIRPGESWTAATERADRRLYAAKGHPLFPSAE